MMMIPSAFGARSTTSLPSTRKSSRSEITRPRSTPVSVKETKTELPISDAVTILPDEKSEPVAIPMIRPLRHQSSTQTVRSAGRNGSRTAREKPTAAHDSSAMPPAVAALLAMTAIPPPPRRINGRKKATPVNSRRISIDELVQEWKRDVPSGPSSLMLKSPLEILLEPAEEDCTEDVNGDLVLVTPPENTMDAEYFESESISRSVSSVSLMSTPSLDEGKSTLQSWTPRTPRSPLMGTLQSRRQLSDKKEKVALSPPKECCLEDHPLRTPIEPDFTASDFFSSKSSNSPPPATPTARSPPASKSKTSTLKSNLTASFAALKSAAKSFSNFAATTVPSDDLLTRSIMGPRWASEMRPNFHGTPDPALRRYFNPTAYGGIDAHFSAQLRNALGAEIVPEDVEVKKGTPMIQMQTYRRSAKKTASRDTTPAKSSEVGPPYQNGVRQREPRENSAFLRVIVLEMNMRRSGKLDHKIAGRARVWLPPRKNDMNKGLGKRRWIAVSADGEDMD